MVWTGTHGSLQLADSNGNLVMPLKEGLPVQLIPKYRHCLNGGGGGLTLAWIFVKDLSTCTEGPQR